MKLITIQMEARRERILTSARALIGERGYSGLTMRELALASQVTVPTIYNLIGGKEDVLLAAIEEQNHRFVRGIETHASEPEGIHLLSVMDAVVTELLRTPSYYRALVPLLFKTESAPPARVEVARALVTQFNRGMEELVASGALASWVDPDVVVRRLLSHLGSTTLEWAGGDLGPDSFRAAALYEGCLVLMGITTGPTRRRLQFRATRLQSQLQTRREPRSSGQRRPRLDGAKA